MIRQSLRRSTVIMALAAIGVLVSPAVTGVTNQPVAAQLPPIASVYRTGLVAPPKDASSESIPPRISFDVRGDAAAVSPSSSPAPAERLIDRIIAAEGGPGPNPSSSAYGYGQFLRGTWLDLFGKLYPQLSRVLSPEQILALREIRPLAAQLTDQYAQLNATLLRQQGLPASDATLSLAHAIGPGGAIDILTAPADQPVATLLSAEALAANPRLKDMTALDLQNWAANRILVPAVATAPSPVQAPPPPLVLSPKHDFHIDGGLKASQVLASDQTEIARLQDYLAGRGAAPGAVIEVLRSVSRRPGFVEFSQMANPDHFARLPADAAHDVARALLNKLQQETATILDIAQHR